MSDHVQLAAQEFLLKVALLDVDFWDGDKIYGEIYQRYSLPDMRLAVYNEVCNGMRAMGYVSTINGGWIKNAKATA